MLRTPKRAPARAASVNAPLEMLQIENRGKRIHHPSYEVVSGLVLFYGYFFFTSLNLGFRVLQQ